MHILQGENAMFLYGLLLDFDTFEINEFNGEITVKSSQQLDREMRQDFELTVRIT